MFNSLMQYRGEKNCGDCNLCCKLPHINPTHIKNKPFKKKGFTWCENCKIGEGCTVYNNRPKTCKDFECFYLIGFQKERPNKGGFLAIPEEINGVSFADGKVLTIYCEPHKLNHLIKNIHKEWNTNMLANQGYIFKIRFTDSDKDLYLYDPSSGEGLVKVDKTEIEEFRDKIYA